MRNWLLGYLTYDSFHENLSIVTVLLRIILPKAIVNRTLDRGLIILIQNRVSG